QKVQLVGVLENGNDQAPIECDCDTNVHVPVITNAVAFNRSIDDGELLKRNNRRADEKWHEGQANAVALLEARLQFVAEIDDAGQVNFEHRVDVSAGAARFDHALRDDLAHVGQRN